MKTGIKLMVVSLMASALPLLAAINSRADDAAPATDAALATAPDAASATTPDANSTPTQTGTVIFCREKKFAGAAVSYKVREGTKELGKLSSGTYFVVHAPVGKHEYIVHSEAKDILTLEVESDETYYVIGGISMGFMVGHPNLSPSNQATYEGMKDKLKDVTGQYIKSE